MTLKEKVMEIDPDKVSSCAVGGVLGCPSEIELFGNNYLCPYRGQQKSYEKCAECWNREYTENDNVNHPSHYETGKFECIDVMIETQGVEAVKHFCICNAFKYIYRHLGKNGLEDVKKAQWYIKKYIELEETK